MRVYLASDALHMRGVPIVAGFFELAPVRNTGAAFGVMPGQRVLFILTTIAILAGIGFVWFRYRPEGRLVVIALGLVVGGALGNLVDRVLFGRVTDFLHFYYRPIHFDFPVFNIADSAIVVGVVVLVAWLLFRKDDEDEGPAERREGE